jgi:transketolase
MAIAEAYLAARNRGFEILDHFTYGIVSDGDLMEGVAAEAASLAGHLKLGKLIYLYDNNHISLPLRPISFTEDCAKRLRRIFGIRRRGDGNDLEAIDRRNARGPANCGPVLVRCARTSVTDRPVSKIPSRPTAPLGAEEAQADEAKPRLAA